MTNMAIAIIYIAIMIVTGVFFLITYTGGNRKRPVAKAYLFIAIMMLGWLVCEILFSLTQNSTLARLLYDWKLPFVALSVTTTIPFTMYFYHLDRYLNKATYILIYLIPIITTLFALTSPLHNLIREELVITTNPVLHTSHNVRGIWFWVHSIQSYITVAGVLVLIIRQHYKMPRAQRAASNFLLFGMTLTLALSIISVSEIFASPLDITLIGMCIALIFLYIGTAVSEKAGFLSLARDEVFNNMNEMVFVLHTDNTIVEMNQSAKRWTTRLQIKQTQNFDDIIDRLRAAGADVKPAPDEDEGMDFYLPPVHGEIAIVNFKENNITDNDGEIKGKFYLCTDVTKSRAIFCQLAEHAENDPLTGLQNRRGFEQATIALDIPPNLPLAVIFGDLNGLKQVNDTLGHKQGDQLIVTTASLLKNTCPASGRLFRIGGDEFVMLIPNYTAQLTKERVKEIYSLFESSRNISPQPSIALGYAVKEDPKESLLAVIEEADNQMYENKQKLKAAQKANDIKE
ncbi:diguanylate cyclase domain-containing protein [Christensenella minuta]|uniref:diguanylate cyclase domain-containing protein n=1 Tax=Christensenella minuta TaxID=626937 RepID=UPI0021573A2D|nr:diguanylate cyclase [Christensenella minuta]